MSQNPNPGIRSSLSFDFQLQAPAPYKEICYEQWIKEETRLDSHAGSRTQDPRAQEDASQENSQVAEANRGRNAAKSIQSRIVSRHARLMN
jgi:hypothetical protein